MNLLKLAWRNIINEPLTLFLNLILLALGVGLINFILLLNSQLKDKFDKNLAGVDLVIGAKGSPLQMILSSMYHIDAPTGNISIKEAKPFLREGYPLFSLSAPLSIGDNHQGYRIIGTDHTFLEFYKAEIGEGKLWNNLYEVTIGSEVAKALNMTLGSQFTSSHGFHIDEDMTHDHGTLTVVGVLKPTGSVIDQLILVNTESVWAVHDHGAEHEAYGEEHEGHDHGAPSGKAEGGHEGHDHAGHDNDHEGHDHSGHDHEAHDHEGHDHSGHDHAGHDHSGHDHGHEGHDHSDHRNDMSRAHLLTHEDKDITSVIVRFKSKTNFQALQLPRNINENTDMQAASPAYELNRLYDMMGVGSKALELLAYLIAIVSAISVFVSLLNSLKRRKYELSLLRVMGGRPASLLTLILLEGFILALLGFLLGMLVSHVSMMALGDSLHDKYNYRFEAWMMHGKEMILFLGAIGLGLLAALLPAVLAYKTDIHENLSH